MRFISLKFREISQDAVNAISDFRQYLVFLFPSEIRRYECTGKFLGIKPNYVLGPQYFHNSDVLNY